MENSIDEDMETMREPLLKDSTKGGLITMPFVIANGMLEKVASYGLAPNMTLYLKSQYHLEMIKVSNIIFSWLAACNFMPVIGAIMADSYVGRFNMIGFGSVAGVLGMILLWLTTVLPGVRPPPCDKSSEQCSSATTPQLLLLCISLAVIAIGGGGIRSSSLAFGVDQLINKDSQGKGGLMAKFYGWYYATYMLSMLFGYTCLVYIQDKMGWEFGYGVSVVLMVIAALCFFIGTPFYVKAKAKANLITELIQVIVASYKKRHIRPSFEDVNMIYHHKKGSRSFPPSEKYRFLNKACILQDSQQELTPDGRERDPWSLCTVDQVEDLKSLLKVIPIGSTGMIAFISMSQSSFSVLQASSVNRKIIANFEIPAGSFGTFSLICIALWVPFYDQVIIRIITKIKGKPTHFSTKQRMGAGILVSIISSIVMAAVEGIRRSQAPTKMSALWLIPQYCLMGSAEGLLAIAQSEFFLSEFPKSMWSIASNLSLVQISLANILASFLMSIIDDLTKRGDNDSWVSTDINKGHYDYYFWVLSAVGLVNFMCFLLCCWSYGPCRDEQQEAKDDEDVLL